MRISKVRNQTDTYTHIIATIYQLNILSIQRDVRGVRHNSIGCVMFSVVCTFFVGLVKCRNSIEIKTKLIRFLCAIDSIDLGGFCLFKAVCQFQFHFISFVRSRASQFKVNKTADNGKHPTNEHKHKRLAFLQFSFFFCSLFTFVKGLFARN